MGTILPYFPAPLPDEALVSQVARYHILRAHRSERLTYEELFNATPFGLTYWVPPNLDRLANKLSGDPEESLGNMLEKSTLLPLFRVFGKGIQGGDDENKNQKMRVVAPRRIVGESGTSHICPSCIVEDTEEYGTPYIHRSHQIPGVTACWKHGIKTLVRCQFCRCPFEIPKGLILSPWKGCNCGRHIDASVGSLEQALPIEVEFAKFTRDLLSGSVYIEPELLVNVYKAQILELGFRRGGNQISRSALFSAIEETYGHEQLQKIDSVYSKCSMRGWMHILQTTTVTEVPLGRLLLLTHFLFREADLFFNEVKRTRSERFIAQNQIGSRVVVDTVKEKNEGGKKRLRKEELVEMLVKEARCNKFGLDELWRNQHSNMKKLVKLDPDATNSILERLNSDDQDSTDRNSSGILEINYDQKADERLAMALKQAADVLYSSTEYPARITKNKVLKSTKLKISVWPSISRFPLAYSCLQQCAESQWHFFARRMIWTICKYPEYEGLDGKLFEFSKLEFHKGMAVYRYFCHIDRKRQIKTNSIITILEEMGIQKNWQGPNPERVYYETGRRYTRHERSIKNSVKSAPES